MIEAVINRMAASSFVLKGWSVVLACALFAPAAGDSQALFVYLAYFPAIAFWVLDRDFLWQERFCRRLHERARTMAEADMDFSMDTSVGAANDIGWSAAILSNTLLIFHGTVFGSIVIVMFVIILTRR
jgi:hypothetical protein